MVRRGLEPTTQPGVCRDEIGGSLASLETARRFPVRLVESGPAGGAILAGHIAAERGEDRILSFDMGGTTAKICRSRMASR